MDTFKLRLNLGKAVKNDIVWLILTFLFLVSQLLLS